MGLRSLGGLLTAFTLARGKAASQSVVTKILSILAIINFSLLFDQVEALLGGPNSTRHHLPILSLKASVHL
jgi:hypothetical protein